MATDELAYSDLVAAIDLEINAGEQLTQQALLRAARHIQEKMPIPIEISIPIEDGVDTYDFADQVPEGFIVKCIEWVMYCGVCIEVIDPCDHCPHGYEICDMNMQQITLHPRPVANTYTEPMKIRLHLSAKFLNGMVPAYFCRFSDLLTDLATAYLVEKPNYEWSNPGYARELRTRADACIISNTVRQSRSGSASVRETEGDPVL